MGLAFNGIGMFIGSVDLLVKIDQSMHNGLLHQIDKSDDILLLLYTGIYRQA